MSNFSSERREQSLEELRQCIAGMRALPGNELSKLDQFCRLTRVINASADEADERDKKSVNVEDEKKYFEFFEQDIYDVLGNVLTKCGVTIKTFRGELFPFPLYILKWKNNKGINLPEALKLMNKECGKTSTSPLFEVNEESLDEVLNSISDAKLGTFMKKLLIVTDESDDIYQCVVKVLNLLFDSDDQSVTENKQHLQECSDEFVGRAIKSLAKELFH